jgi:hypothetical protein
MMHSLVNAHTQKVRSPGFVLDETDDIMKRVDDRRVVHASLDAALDALDFDNLSIGRRVIVVDVLEDRETPHHKI